MISVHFSLLESVAQPGGQLPDSTKNWWEGLWVLRFSTASRGRVFVSTPMDQAERQWEHQVAMPLATREDVLPLDAGWAGLPQWNFSTAPRSWGCLCGSVTRVHCLAEPSADWASHSTGCRA